MRSHYCGALNEQHLDSEVYLYGWVHRRRDMGGVVFVDLRDRTGLLQVVFEPDQAELFALAEKLRNEYVIWVKGKVRGRPEGMANPDLSTGQVEVLVTELKLLNTAETPPFQIDEHQKVGEETRLRYRYIDLRRPEMCEKIKFRAKIKSFLHRYLDSHGFLDIETPYLTRSTPEGARDYLVPSRVYKGHFFALPQSPQLFKQLLMISGFDRYYQIVRCFRDEDLRADRQPEFTQLDIETSFMNETEIMHFNEEMIRALFHELLQIDLPEPFAVMPYQEAMDRYGSDRPDLRIPLELVTIDDLVKACDFKVFSTAANAEHGRVAALRVPEGCTFSRKQLDDYGDYVANFGAKGLAYFKVEQMGEGISGIKSPILKFLSEEVVLGILDRVKAQPGDVVFFGADMKRVVNESLGALRVKVAQDLELIEPGWQVLWVVDFPMFQQDENLGRWEPLHHPFTAPHVETPEALLADPENAHSKAYDLVLNGLELGGGSVRINNMDMQNAVFKLLGMSEEESQEKFGFLLEALKYGAPPHGGIAFGLDRLAMVMMGTDSIRDVIAFPKTQTSSCLLSQAPETVDLKQLQELGIMLSKRSEHGGT